MSHTAVNAISIYGATATIRYSIWLIIVGAMVLALLSAVLRPASDFSLARMSKSFWIGALGAGLVVYAWPYLIPLYLPFGGLLQWVAIFAVIYYFGPESQRMGPLFRRRGGRGGRGGSSGRNSGW